MSHATLRYASLNVFVLTMSLMSSSPASAALITLDQGTANGFNTTTSTQSSGSQAGFPVDGIAGASGATYDGDHATGWGIGSNENGIDHTAVWESTTNLNSVNGTDFTFTMIMDTFDLHTIGKFRLSVTTDDRSSYADDGQTNGDITPTNPWNILTPISVTGTGTDPVTHLGATFAIDPSTNIVLVSGGNPTRSTYTVHATTTLVGITGFRLETFHDSGFARNSSGRSSNGNFVLSEFQVDAVALPEPASLGVLAIAGCAMLVRRRSQIA